MYCSYSQLHLKKPPPRTPAFEVHFVSARAKPQPSAATSFNTSKHQLRPIPFFSCFPRSSSSILGQLKPSRCLPKNVPCICKVRLKRNKRALRCLHWPATTRHIHCSDTQNSPRGLQKSSGATGPRLARESCNEACCHVGFVFFSSLLNGPRNIIGDPLACPRIK